MIASNGSKPTEDTILLELEDIHMAFGKIVALAGVSLKIAKGEIHSVIGPNGGGKTSLLNCISGFYHPDQGEILNILGEKA